MKYLAVIPTYNELLNIEKLIESVFKFAPEINILIVDDNSPDGTGNIADKMALGEPRLKVLHREGKQGLGSAYVAGFKYALEKGYDFIFEMDADFSHNPERLPLFIEKAGSYDLVIGSRYINGISVVNWPLKRLLLSIFANLYVRIILCLPVKDATSGFKCFKAEVLRAVNLDKIKSDGYSFQIEMNYRARKSGFKICEIPIIFIDRHSGTSKLNRNIVIEALLIPWQLRFENIFGKKNNK
ncbi:MAG: dolichyl-phosphate beta-D-mannosyltransferase [Candidatus Firestonebacteria bacterium RIFOXYC2_FULL_39_67]|nr:MAG: dolichyl-phosphate beta-D-mannosyltransferase [Candidatus Firestonebacteria bacterium RIFOXYD2_FULL_39_29]OGF55443.1 MAG: dolichyl-phosphate beta-D-mannosyltransferase [Candidatus Firestonebacteria bacterium RIFOXYC2_FULL_39_67]OGF57718.1 MAG: dolichyl-phosphate beta-D-mannosyltransferase [Candidatus Firestonebacteria bacterium RifOxyC12_full_39_7]